MIHEVMKGDEPVRRPRRRAEETRQDILTTAEDLFRERGIGRCSIADIAHQLQMSPANVFKHFGSKTQWADAICDRHINRMIDRFALLRDPAPAPQKLGIVVRKLMEAHLSDIRENPYLFEMILVMSDADLPSGRHYKDLVNSLFTEVIREGLDSGVYQCREDPALLSTIVSAAFMSVLHPLLLAKTDADELHERCEGLINLVNAALQNPLAK